MQMFQPIPGTQIPPPPFASAPPAKATCGHLGLMGTKATSAVINPLQIVVYKLYKLYQPNKHLRLHNKWTSWLAMFSIHRYPMFVTHMFIIVYSQICPTWKKKKHSSSESSKIWRYPPDIHRSLGKISTFYRPIMATHWTQWVMAGLGLFDGCKSQLLLPLPFSLRRSVGFHR